MSTTTRRAPCPICDRGPKDTALSVTTDERGTVEFCHRCGFKRANNVSTIPPRIIQKASGQRWSDLADALWSKSLPLRYSLAEKYLARRCCALPPEDGDVRFLPAAGAYPASMLARITDAISGAPMSLHFTRLTESGEKIDRRLLKRHQKSGGVVRLWPDDAVCRGLGLAEGIENALSAAHILTPVWATVDAGNLAVLPVVSGVEVLTIYADHDAAGISSAKKCAMRWRDAGREVRVRLPRRPGADMNDLARGAA